jgi:PAT family beta-lactamase induction signal transducer AmpG
VVFQNPALAPRFRKKKLAASGPALDHRWTVSTPTVPPPTESTPPAKSKRALLWTSTTYFGEGLPWSFLHQMAAEFLTAIGASNAQVGMTSALHGAVTLKFLWSPIVDLFGRKRSWLWIMQVILGLGMIAVGALVPSGNLTLFWAALAVISIFHATHDIACDGFYLQALDRKGQALFAGTRIAAFRVATLVGSSALVWVAAKSDWMVAFAVAGVLMVATAGVNRVVMPHPEEHHPQDAAAGAAPKPTALAFLEAYKTFLTQPKAVLVLSFLLLYRVGDIMMFGQSKPFLRDLGVTTAQRGILNGFSISFTILGSIVGGAIIARKGLARCLVPIAYLQNLAIPLYVLMAVVRPTLPGIVAIVLTEQFVAGVGAVAFSVFQMQRTRKAFSAAHFAFMTAVVSASSMVPGMVSGFISQRVGFPLFFTIAFLASLPSLVLVHFVPKEPIESEAR